MNKIKLPFVAILLFVYLVTAGISYAIFNTVGSSSPKTEFATPLPEVTESGFTIDPAEPKTEICPLNGMLYTPSEKAVWESRIPLAVMIENHPDARPQSGLSQADIVYEAVAEGGITRFMAVYYCDAAQNINLAPVRSARTYYLPWVLEYDAAYVHVGGATCDSTVDPRARALCQIDDYGIRDMDQFGLPFKVCRRNYDRVGREVATEHTMECLSSELFRVAEKRGWTTPDKKTGDTWAEDFTSWSFADPADLNPAGDVTSISFNFWDGYKDFAVIWEYDTTAGKYYRTMGGQPHTDLNTNTRISASNVAILFAKETGPVDDHKHLLYANTGSGKAIIFQNGQAIKGTWKKAKKATRTMFYNTQGRQIEFIPGQIWIEMLPAGNEVKY